MVHLHNHTQWSLLDGMCRIDQMVSKAKEMGQSAIAITDHGAMYGVIDFYRAAKKAGIKPIIGCEVYVAPRSRQLKEHGIDDKNYHLVLLCENEVGYKNLCYLVSQAYLTGFYYKPRVDKALLKSHHQGLVALSGCVSGEVASLLLGDESPTQGQQEDLAYQAAKAAALEYSEIFGPDHFYLEMQDHGVRKQIAVNRGLRKISAETGLPLVITNDAHYINREDAPVQEVLLCISTGKTLNDTHMRFETEEFYLKSEEEMRAVFPHDSDAFTNTDKIAEMCNFDFEFGHYHLPAFDPPDGLSNDAYFEKLCWDGFAERYPVGAKGDKEQLQYEISMIQKMGFVNYFLIVSDYIRWAKKQGIPVGPGRGSAAGSMVSYCLHITDLDPRQYGLYFERFLNPERVSMPDIDVDFCVNRRQEVIDYVTEKYGKENVAQIITFGTLKAKGAVRDVGRVLGYPYADVDKISKMIPKALDTTLESALEDSPDLKLAYDSSEDVKKIIDMAMRVEGLPRNASTHAAAVVIASAPVYDFAPLATAEGTLPVIQYNMITVEEIGLLKMDFLGLRNLTVIEDTQQLIRKKLPDFDISKVDLFDKKVYDMLAKGQTSGVFQMESPGMTGVCMDLEPESIEDLTAIVALYRPGPMDSIPTFVENKKSPDRVTYVTPYLKPILEVTYGTIVYQEQVIEIFKQLGGYSLGQADNIRRAISKKKHSVIEAERATFINGDPEKNIPGAVQNGVSEKAANEIYDKIIDFASYAFNKAHAVCYAAISYETAYLKCHFPVEYMAALMSSVIGDGDKLTAYIVEAKDSGIDVLAPCVNLSDVSFRVEGSTIRFPLNAIKGVGSSVSNSIVSLRGSGYKDFDEFIERTLCSVNKSAYEKLIKAGATDVFGLNRNQMLLMNGVLVDAYTKQSKKNVEGQIGLFDFEDTSELKMVPPAVEELPQRELLKMEKEALGVYMSGHPFENYAPYTRSLMNSLQIRDLYEQADNDRTKTEFSACGILTNIKIVYTKKKQTMAKVTIEDALGNYEAIIFSAAYETYKNELIEEAPVAIKGQIFSGNNGDMTLAIQEIMPLDRYILMKNKSLYLKIPEEKKEKIMSLFKNNTGTTYVVFCEDSISGTRSFAREYHSINIGILRGLHSLLEADRIVFKDNLPGR